jgi:hypothetical protein
MRWHGFGCERRRELGRIRSGSHGMILGAILAYLEKLKKHGAAALLVVGSLVAFGCLGGGGSLTNLPDTELAEVKLQIRLGRVDADAPASGGLPSAKASADAPERIQLRDMVLRFTSNLRDTVMDTVLAGVGTGFSGSQDEDQAVTVNVALKPLRWWKIEIKTHDVYDSIIHYANVGPIPSKGGQSVSLDVPLINSRYSLYEARYVLPEHVYPSGVPDSERVYQKIFFTRLVLRIDSAVVRDSSSFAPGITSAGTRFIGAGTALANAVGKLFFRPSRLAPDTITHIQAYKYVRTGPRSFNIRAYGYLEGDSVGIRAPRLLFEGTRSVTIAPGATVPEMPIVLDWKGPGSSGSTPSDTVRPGDPDWSGITMKVFIGKVGKVVQDIVINPGIP